MKLKSLEVIGFKSFVDRLHLSFPKGITAVVGPNGCGKSNIVDAILWAIGERSAKHLRGRLMEDVIFGGAEGRKALGMAEVNLTFVNDDGLAPKTYEPYTEITVTRRLFRSGESEYLLNHVPCRLRDVTDLFLDTGIGVNGYSIVEQGRVEHLINANPQERRFLIEEAAGIAKYKERKRLALMKMEAAQQNLLRIQDIIAEVKRQIVSLERQVKRAEEYKGLRREMKEIEVRFAFQEYTELSEKGEASRGYLKALRDRDLTISTQASEREASIEEMRLRGMEEEEQLRFVQQEVFELGRKIQKMESEVEFFRREEGRLQKQENQLIEEVRESLGSWRGARRERKRTEQIQRHLEEERRQNEEILKEWEILFNDFRATYQDVSEQLEREKNKLIDTITQLTSLKNRRSHLEERRKDLQKRIRSQERESEEVRSSMVQTEEGLLRTGEEKELTLSIQAILRREKDRWEGEIEKLKEALHAKQTERFALDETLRQDRSRFFSLKELQDNYEGFEKGVKSLLLRKREEQEKWERILGVVADIFEPAPQYEVPLEAVLGQRLQYLIVEGEKEAMEAIALLKREFLGRGSFIPVGVKGFGNHDQSLPTETGEKPSSLLQFVHVKEGFASLAQFLIGEVGVVNHLEEALYWIKQEEVSHTIVTLEGEVVERSGVVSGGSLDQGLSILERRREIKELEKRTAEEEEACRKASEEEEGLQREMAERESLLEKRKKEIQEKEIELLHQEKDLEGLRKELSQSQQKMEILQMEGQDLREEEGDIEEETKSVLSQMEREETMKGEKEQELQSLKKTVEEVREGAEEMGGKITEKKVFLASIEEKEKGLEGQILNLSENLKTWHEQIIRKVKGIRECRKEGVSLRERINQWERELENCLVEHRSKEETFNALKERVEAFFNELKEAEASSRYLRHELEDLRQKIHEEDLRFSEIQLKLQHLQDSMKERYGSTLSASMGTVPAEFPREEMTRRLEELKLALEGFGEVNLMALEEYQELKQRHDFLMEQQTDLQQALDTLRKTIIRINRTTTKRFLETFHLVNEKFKEIFLRLFKGGQANLVP